MLRFRLNPAAISGTWVSMASIKSVLKEDYFCYKKKILDECARLMIQGLGCLITLSTYQ